MGSEALEQLQAEGVPLQLVGLEMRSRAIPRQDYAIQQEGEPIGFVTSGTFSFFLNRGVGMASLAAGEAEAGDRVEIEIRGRTGVAELVSLPIYRGSVKSPTASKN